MKHFNYDELLGYDKLYDLYITKNMRKTDISKMTGIKTRTLDRMIAKYGIVKDRTASIKLQQETNLKKYGTTSALKSDIIKEKVKQTNLKKYGCEWTMQNKEVKDKAKKTNIEKYGVDNPFASKEIQNKIKQTNINKYGVEHPLQNEELKQKAMKTCQRHYGTKNPFASKEIQNKIQTVIEEKYGVPYMCLAEECQSVSNSSNTKPNNDFAKLLEENGIKYEREFKIGAKSYDFKIENILVEIDPSVTHNSTISFKGRAPLDKNYHLNKTTLAEENGYKCIHIFDWDDKNKIINMLKPKEKVYARSCEVREIGIDDCCEFIQSYHIQGMCKNQKIMLGLYYNNELVEVMTFGKPRYNTNYKYELLRLCTDNKYNIIGGAGKLFDYFINKYNSSVISYCDSSKFNGSVYKNIGFKLLKSNKPSKHWYSLKTKEHYTDNIIRQQGFSRIINKVDYNNDKLDTNNNDLLMINADFIEIYDCGQDTWVYKVK